MKTVSKSRVLCEASYQSEVTWLYLDRQLTDDKYRYQPGLYNSFY